MIPLRDNVPSRRIPWLNYTLIAVNAAIFFYQIGLPRAAQYRLIGTYGLIPSHYTATGLPFLGYLPFLAAIFLHGGLLHLVSNMWVLWLFGDNVEDRLGPVRYLLLYLGSGLAANVLHYYANPASALPTVGASGAIAGVMGAYFLLYPRARIITLIPVFFYPLIVEIPAAFFLVVWFVTQLLNAGVQPAGGGGVAWWAHVGGFLTGLAGLVILRATCHQHRCYEDEYAPW